MTKGKILNDTIQGNQNGEELGHVDRATIADIKRIENLYLRALIPEMNIMDKSLEELNETIEYLDNLRALLTSFHHHGIQDDEDDISTLMGRIDRDIALYMHFASNPLTLEGILNDLADGEVEGNSNSENDLVAADFKSSPSISFPSNLTSVRESIVAGSLHFSANTIRTSTSRINLRNTPPRKDDIMFSIPPGPTGIFKWTVLRGLSSSIKQWERSVGRITCFAVKAMRILFGTDHSKVLVYDLSQNLVGMLKPNNEANIGTVTCIDCCLNMSHIIVGYSSGHVILWEGGSLQPVKVIAPINERDVSEGKDGHLEGAPILWVNSYSSEKFYSADAKGSAFYHTVINRVIYSSINTIRIHGKRGSLFPTTIHSVAPLPKSSTRMFSDPFQLVAITSTFKIAILSMKPTPQIQFRATWGQLNKSEKQLDVKVAHAEIKWWIPQSKNEDLSARLLAFSNGSNLSLMRIEDCAPTLPSSSKRKLVFKIASRAYVDSDVCAIEWINAKLLLCFTANGFFKIYDAQSLGLIEQVTLAPRTLIPNHHFNQETAGIKPGQIVHHSLCTFFNRIFVLSDGEISFASLISWQDRLSILMKAGKFSDALKIGVDLYHGNCTIAALQTPCPLPKVVVSTHIRGLLINLVVMTVEGYDALRDEDVSSYRSLAVTVFETCLAIEDLSSVLEYELWDRFLHAGLQDVFLDVLKDFVFQDGLSKIGNPSILKYMFDSQEDPDTLEQVLLHLDPDSLDFPTIIGLCHLHGFTNALISLTNRGLNDFVSPVFSILKASHDDYTSEKSKKKLHILFLYLANIFKGRRYPDGGDLPLETIVLAGESLLKVLFSRKQEDIPNKETLKTPWPCISFLIHADCVEMLNVLGSAFESQLLDKGVPCDDPDSVNAEPLLITRQYIVGVLLHHFNLSSCSPDDKVSFATFICKSYKKYQPHIALSFEILMDLFNVLLVSKEEKSRLDREYAIQCLYGAGFAPSRAEADQDLYLQKFKDAKLWKLYEKQVLLQKDFDLAIASYLQDSARKHEVYDIIRNWMKDPKDSSRIKDSVDSAFHDLMSDGQQLAILYNQFWPTEHSLNLGKLATDALKFSYLDGICGPVKELIKLESPATIPATTESTFYESYIKLLFSQAPKYVPGYLEYCSKALETLPVSLKLFDVLATTYNLVDAKIWVMLQKKDIKGALNLSIEKIKSKLQDRNIRNNLEQIVMICQQAQPGDSDVWNMFLKEICFKLLKVSSLSSTKFSHSIWQSAFTIAMKHISIPDILLQLIEIESQSSISQHMPLILFLMDAFEHELNSQEQTLILSNTQAFEEFKTLLGSLKCAYSPALGQCQLCRKFFHLRAMTLLEQKDEIVVCRCQHSFHATCLLGVLEKAHFKMRIPGLVDDYDFWCIVCGSPSEKKRKGKGPQAFTSMNDITNGKGELSRSLVNKLKHVDTAVYSRNDLLSCLKNLSVQVSDLKDEINLNE